MAKRAPAKSEAAPSAPATPVRVPTAPEMTAAWAKLEAGDNRAARRIARQLLDAGTASKEALEEARELLGRIGYDPGAALSVGGITLAVLIILVLLTVAHKFD